MPAILIPFLTTQNSSAGGHSRAVCARLAGSGVKPNANDSGAYAGRTVAPHAMLVVERAPARDERRIRKRRHDDRAGVTAHRLAHAGLQQPIHGRRVLLGGRDAVDAGIEDQRAGDERW